MNKLCSCFIFPATLTVSHEMKDSRYTDLCRGAAYHSMLVVAEV